MMKRFRMVMMVVGHVADSDGIRCINAGMIAPDISCALIVYILFLSLINGKTNIINAEMLVFSYFFRLFYAD